MMDRIGRLTRAEFIKLFAQPFLYIALIGLAWIVVSFEFALPMIGGQKETVWRSYHAVQLFVYGFQPGLKVATYVLLIFSSMSVASEFDRGTVKNLLTRPITRLEFFVAKCATVTGLAVLLFGFVFVVSALYALWRGDLGPVWYETDYIIQRDAAEILGHARKAVSMSFLAFLAAGFLGVFVSNTTESSGYAVAIALVVFLVSDLATGMLLDQGKQKLFMYYPAYALDKLQQFSEGGTTRWRPDVDAGLLYLTVPAAYIAAFVPGAFAIFRARNISA
jgi:ABC-type transport system involved in multi-copper enzyme maturation permease subunit